MYIFYQTPEEALAQENKLKKDYRKNKLKLINDFNTDWRDLYEDIT